MNWLFSLFPLGQTVFFLENYHNTKLVGHHFCGDIVRRHLFRDFAGRHFFGELVRAPLLGDMSTFPKDENIFVLCFCYYFFGIWRKQNKRRKLFITFLGYDENKIKEENYFCLNLNSIFHELVVFVIPLGPDRHFFEKSHKFQAISFYN